MTDPEYATWRAAAEKACADAGVPLPDAALLEHMFEEMDPEDVPGAAARYAAGRRKATSDGLSEMLARRDPADD